MPLDESVLVRRGRRIGAQQFVVVHAIMSASDGGLPTLSTTELRSWLGATLAPPKPQLARGQIFRMACRRSYTADVTAYMIVDDIAVAVGTRWRSVRAQPESRRDNTDAGMRCAGISIVAANAAGLRVLVENCSIAGQNGSPGRGIQDFRANGGSLTVVNTTIINVLAAGIVVDPAGSLAGGSGRVDIAISNTRVLNCGFGMNFGSNTKATIFNSVIEGVTNSAIFAVQTSSGATDVNVDHCVVTGNGTGFNASSANTTIRVSNTTATNNTTLSSSAGGGAVLSYGNNQAGGASVGGVVSPG